MNRKTQKSDIIKVLKKRYVSTWDAFELLGCTKLGTRVSEYIREGYNVSKKKQLITTRYGAKVWVTKYKILNTPKNEKSEN